jgi:hypothetical protein
MKLTGLLINMEHGNIVGPLITAVKIRTGWVQAETSWVIASRPLFTDVI